MLPSSSNAKTMLLGAANGKKVHSMKQKKQQQQKLLLDFQGEKGGEFMTNFSVDETGLKMQDLQFMQLLMETHIFLCCLPCHTIFTTASAPLFTWIRTFTLALVAKGGITAKCGWKFHALDLNCTIYWAVIADSNMTWHWLSNGCGNGITHWNCSDKELIPSYYNWDQFNV